MKSIRLQRILTVGACALLGTVSCGSSPATVATRNATSAALVDALGTSQAYGLSMAPFGTGVVVSSETEHGVRLASCNADGSCEPIAADAVSESSPHNIKLVEGSSDPLLIAGLCDETGGECGDLVTFKVFSVKSDGASEIMSFRSEVLEGNSTGQLRFDAVGSDKSHAVVMIGAGEQSALLRLDLDSGTVLNETAVPGQYRVFAPGADGSALVVSDAIDVSTGSQQGESDTVGEAGSGSAASGTGNMSVVNVDADGKLSSRGTASGEVVRSKDNTIYSLSGDGTVRDLNSGERIGSVDTDDSASSEHLGNDTVCSNRTLVLGSYDQSSNDGAFWFAYAGATSVRSQTVRFSGVPEQFQACAVEGKVFVASSTHGAPGLERKDRSNSLSLQVLPA